MPCPPGSWLLERGTLLRTPSRRPEWQPPSTITRSRTSSLADWGRKEIAIAETEMPGLMALREEYGASPAAQGRPHRRLPPHDDPDRGADRDADRSRRRQCAGRRATSSRPRTTRPPPIAAAGIPVFAWKGETEEEFWWCIEQTLRGPDGWTPNMILDDGGDLTQIMHEKYPELLNDVRGLSRRDHDRRAPPL